MSDFVSTSKLSNPLKCSPVQAWENNVAIVNELAALAQKKNVSPAQFSIAWVSSLGSHVVPLPGSSYVDSGHLLIHLLGELH